MNKRREESTVNWFKKSERKPKEKERKKDRKIRKLNKN